MSISIIPLHITYLEGQIPTPPTTTPPHFVSFVTRVNRRGPEPEQRTVSQRELHEEGRCPGEVKTRRNRQEEQQRTAKERQIHRKKRGSEG